MARLDKLKAAFRRCSGPYPWSDFESMILGMGYERIRSGKTGGSRRKFHHPGTGHTIFVDEPHDGEMRRGMVRRLQDELSARGVL
jgi:hypothetical protein